MKKKGSIIFILLSLLVIFIVGSLLLNSLILYDLDCLNNISEDYCNEIGEIYHPTKWWDKSWDYSPKIYCSENERGSEVNQYFFLEEELEGCKR